MTTTTAAMTTISRALGHRRWRTAGEISLGMDTVCTSPFSKCGRLRCSRFDPQMGVSRDIDEPHARGSLGFERNKGGCEATNGPLGSVRQPLESSI